MSTYVVWMDNHHAKLFKIAPGSIEKQKLDHKEIKHHNSHDPNNHKDSERFFSDLAHNLADANEVLLLGPGLGKNHFKSHLDKHNTHGLAQKVVGIETCDHPTDNQILELSRKFFKTYDAFH